jgi:Tol biopolymer transport system component/predicted Ser/Thr protein kinase
MGEVYRGRDTRLGREVAIKVLPSELSASPKLRQRLEREAKTISQLSHPHICTLYDVGREGETDFLVMEYLEGETLSRRLEKAPLSLEQALRTASEVADALDKAHRQGVVHRDLKPGNVMLTKSGAKLLDFGLAKLREPGPVEGVGTGSALPTQARPLTEEGKVVGTYPYMAPEQLEGQVADARTDIFAFGAVLYETVTGQRAFEGKSRASLIAAILSSEPRPIAELQPMTPPLLGRVVKRCLAKDPDERWQSAADLADELRWIAESKPTTAESPPPASWLQRRTPLTWLLFAVAAAGLAAVSTALYFRATRPEAARAAAGTRARFAISLPPRQHVAVDLNNRTLSLSPDGRLLAWTGGPPDRRRLFLRALDSLDVREIPGTEGAAPWHPGRFSPDGERILFVRDGALWSVRLDGGVPTRLLESETATGIWFADWIDGETVIVCIAYSGLHRMPASGGALEPVTHLDRERGEVSHERPNVLPGGRAVLFSVGVGNIHDNHIEVVSLETGARHTIIEDASEAQYASSGHVVFGRDDTLFAVPFDLERLQVAGPAVPVLAPVQMGVATGTVANFALSRTGTLAYLPGDQGLGERRLEWWSRDGKIEPLPVKTGTYSAPRISPDGRQLAITLRQGHRLGLYLYEFARQVLMPLEQEGSWNGGATWSPDGVQLAFASNRAGQWNLFVTRAQVSANAVGLLEHPDVQLVSSWSLNGGLLAYVNRDEQHQFDIFLLPMDEPTAAPVPFLVSDFEESFPAFSPDGRWLAYVSGETGQAEIFIREVGLDNRSEGVHQKVSRDGGWDPVWARDGSELFYLSLDGSRILATTIGPGQKLVLGDEREVLGPLGRWRRDWISEDSRFDVAPDGDRFLVVSPTRAPEDSMRIVVVLDWVQELDRLAPRAEE